MPSVKRTRFRSSGTAKIFLTLSWSIKVLAELIASRSSPAAPKPYPSTSALPPAAAIFSAALPLNLWARTVSALPMSPRASTFTRTSLCTRPFSRSSSGVTSTPASNRSASVSRFTTSYSTRNGLWKPRFGTRRCSGIWPPSNPRLCLKPERDLAPLCPRPAVLPLPDPWPRPTRFLACLAPLGGRRLLRFIILSRVNSQVSTPASPACRVSGDSGIGGWTLAVHLYQVTYFQNHPSGGCVVGQLHGVADAAQAETLDDQLLLLVEADAALAERDSQFFRVALRGCILRHICFFD